VSGDRRGNDGARPAAELGRPMHCGSALSPQLTSAIPDRPSGGLARHWRLPLGAAA